MVALAYNVRYIVTMEKTEAGYPPDVILEHWYKCGRKQALLSEGAAALAVWSPTRHYYWCPFGDHWHVGRPQVAKRDRWLSNARKLWKQNRQVA